MTVELAEAPKTQTPEAEDDFCPIIGFDHVEFYVGNAKQAAQYYAKCFGFTNTAYRGLETGEREIASYVMEQGKIRILLTTALSSDHVIAQQVKQHGDCVGVIALRVPDAERAYRETVSRGAKGVSEVAEREDEQGRFRWSSIELYGDTVMQFIEREHYGSDFGPGFVPRDVEVSEGAGLYAIDHIVGNVELGAMNEWVKFFANTMGFSQLAHFDDDAISTEYSALMSKVMQDGTGKVKFPINEPAEGRKKSQIAEYLEYNNGPGVQHIACATHDIIATVEQLRANGIEFLSVPTTYYDELEARVGKIDEPLDRLAELGILVDRDDDGYLLQIFTTPIEDRPTVFYEIIQRRGSRGFGEGNFKSLFEAIEREQEARGNL